MLQNTLSSRYTKIAFLTVVTLFLLSFISRFWPLGPDYFYTYRPVTEAFFRGETKMYDGNSPTHFLMPWSVFVFFPLAIFPLRYGQAVLSAFSIGAILFSIFSINGEDGEYQVDRLALLLAIANLHTFDLMIRGNIDGYIALGLALSWLGVRKRQPLMIGGGLWLMSIKSANILLATAVIFWAVRKWNLREKVLIAAPMLLTIALSFWVFGVDWVQRAMQLAQDEPVNDYLQTSLWKTFEALGLPVGISYIIWVVAAVAFLVYLVQVDQPDRWTLALALTVNFAFSFYALGYHYILLAPVLVMLVTYDRRFALLWLLTLTPLSRFFFSWSSVWIDAVYPLAMMFCVIYVIRREGKEQGEQEPPHTLAGSGQPDTGVQPL